ncbi:MAG: ATP-binding protein [candidate division Zixibacteria bacterium]|nr:ATP-binding protein [candidate division Zixibacteria bacterium]
MVELVVASGKGGTGKTSIVGSLAYLAKKLILVDCDVDAANLHILLRHKIINENSFSTSHCSQINQDACTSCGTCHDLCRYSAISQVNDPISPGEYLYKIDKMACEGCGLCYHACPEKAITFTPVISGQWFISESEFGPFLHGRLGTAQANSGRLVSLLRREAVALSQRDKSDLIIIDGPPGIGCPVIASITGASFLLVVTEPSRSAIHDLTRLVELAGHFNLQMAICINKHDINSKLTEEIDSFADERNIPVIGKLLFDPGFVEAQVKGTPYFLNASEENKNNLLKMWTWLSGKINDSPKQLPGKFAV